MNPQIAAFLRNTLISLGTAAAVKFGVDAAVVPSVVGVIMMIVGFVWSGYGHTQSSTIAAAAALSDVRAVVTTPLIATSPQFQDDNKVITSIQARGL